MTNDIRKIINTCCDVVDILNKKYLSEGNVEEFTCFSFWYVSKEDFGIVYLDKRWLWSLRGCDCLEILDTLEDFKEMLIDVCSESYIRFINSLNLSVKINTDETEEDICDGQCSTCEDGYNLLTSNDDNTAVH